LNHFWRNSKD